MKFRTKWIEKLRFSAQIGAYEVPMDAKVPIGSEAAPTPKELVLAALCGCTGMDVVALLKKYKQPLESFEVEAEAESREGGHPAIFRQIKLIFELRGKVEPEKVLEAIRLSQTKYCSVSGMLSKAVPISYEVRLNSRLIGFGEAKFT